MTRFELPQLFVHIFAARRMRLMCASGSAKVFYTLAEKTSWSWTRGGEPVGSITVQVEGAAVVLSYRNCNSGSSEWKSIQQRVLIRLTACHFDGVRPWFVCPAYCNGRYGGRRAAILYCAGKLFACRRCYGSAYESQQRTALHRGLEQARKIRMRLGGARRPALSRFLKDQRECIDEPSCAFGPERKRRCPVDEVVRVVTFTRSLECALSGGHLAGLELTKAVGLSEDESHGQAPLP